MSKYKNLDIGTLGSLPCEVSLNDILIRFSQDNSLNSNDRIIYFTLSQYQNYRNGLNQLNLIKNKSFAKNMARIWKENCCKVIKLKLQGVIINLLLQRRTLGVVQSIGLIRRNAWNVSGRIILSVIQ